MLYYIVKTQAQCVIKLILKWNSPVDIIVRSVRKGDLVSILGNAVEADIDDLMSANRISDVLGCDGALRLHFRENEITDTLFGGFPIDVVFFRTFRTR